MEMQQQIIHKSDDDDGGGGGGNVDGCHVLCLSPELGYMIGGL